MKSLLSIQRIHADKDHMEIVIEDYEDCSRRIVVSAELESFMKALTGLSCQPCDLVRYMGKSIE